MDLDRRFRLDNHSKIALVGGGGKTTLMFQLARDFGKKVICTTSTHLALDQLGAADKHFIITAPADLPGPDVDFPGDVLLFTGPQVETNRMGSPSPALLEDLAGLADSWDCPLIIESDGARKLPIKAPAEHEPPIPGFVNVVITVIGLSGLGKPLRGDWVHRPELYSKLVDLPLGETLESHHLIKGLISPEGGVKNIPPGARRILLINQIDSFPNWKTFYEQMDLLLDHFSLVGFSVLEDQMLLEVHERIAGVVLAAGGSSRFGEPKQLLDWHGKPLVRHVVELATAGGLNPVVVVTGADHDAVSEALRGSRIEVACNPGWESGQSSSVRVGIEALPGDLGGAVFLLVDQPLISPELIQKIVQQHQRTQAAIVLPVIEGNAGNPVLFDRQVFTDLTLLGGDVGGRALFEKFPVCQVAWGDKRSQEDIDTPEDYQRIRFGEEC
ncbi:MAG: putative selenium-dependent hydroxylase accessory protein YqeC [Chloroflexi bacterium]|nr:MAG: putative selenium-dependent hydroxylase accessory protein YqeC [Chloroflexota bacterium]